MTSPNISEMATVAIESRRRKLADNVSDNTALLNRLKRRGKRVPITGGRTIYEELEYAENETYKRFSGYEVLDIQPSDVFTAAEFDLRQVAVAVTISGLERLQNSGKEQMIPLLKKRVGNAEKTMINGLSGDLYSNGEADGGKQVDGLQAAITTDSDTGTYGGINRANHTFWRHKYKGGINLGSVSLRDEMMKMYVQLCRNMDKIDLIPSGNDMFIAFWETLQDQQRFTNPNMGKMGFLNIKFMNADVVLDGGLGGSADTRDMYFLNTAYLNWRPHKDQDMTSSDDRYATNQDAMVKFIMWAGNLTCSNLSLQGRLQKTA